MILRSIRTFMAIVLALSSFIHTMCFSEREQYPKDGFLSKEINVFSRGNRSPSLGFKAVIKSAKYIGIENQAKVFRKLGGQTEAIADFKALHPRDIIFLENGYIRGFSGDKVVYLNIKPPVSLFVKEDKYFNLVRYISPENF